MSSICRWCSARTGICPILKIDSSFGSMFRILLAVLAIALSLITSCHFLRFRVIYGPKTPRCRMTLHSSLLSCAGPQTQSGAEFCCACKLSTPPVCSTTPPTPFSTTYCCAQYSLPPKPFPAATWYSGTPASTASTAHDALGFAKVASTPHFTSLYFTHMYLISALIESVFATLLMSATFFAPLIIVALITIP